MKSEPLWHRDQSVRRRKLQDNHFLLLVFSQRISQKSIKLRAETPLSARRLDLIESGTIMIRLLQTIWRKSKLYTHVCMCMHRVVGTWLVVQQYAEHDLHVGSGHVRRLEVLRAIFFFYYYYYYYFYITYYIPVLLFLGA